MTNEEARELWHRARYNAEALARCKRHAFSRDLSPGLTFGKRWQCTRCGGEVNSNEKFWYENGIRHAEEEACAR